MLIILIALFIIGWTAAAVIGTQAYFRGEQTKPIHTRNWRSESFETLAKSVTGRDIDHSERIPAFVVDAYASQNLPSV
jgi:hypothetical protein